MQIENITGKIEEKLPGDLRSFGLIYHRNRGYRTKRIVALLLGIALVCLFLPWTQNIQAKGYVSTLYQNERPQELASQIPGKILKWYVKEGDYVKKGDTIVQLGEIKDDYLDPLLIPRTQNQISANENKADFYREKIATADRQISNLEQQRDLKLRTLENKLVQIDRKIEAKQTELAAAKTDVKQFNDQLLRAKKMLAEGAISQLDYERRNASFQKALAVANEKETDLNNLKQDIAINKLDINNAVQEYAEKIAKAQGDQFSSNSEIASAQEKTAALEIKKKNIEQRAGYYFVMAPQNGQIVDAAKAGINELIKEGEKIVEIVPEHTRIAVEIFVEPMDLPLIAPGQNMRFRFDGFPAIVFSGWPAASYGTFSGRIFAIESNRNKNGKFRVLVTEDTSSRAWPVHLTLGAGAYGFALLKDVPVWYELWRNINGFPPDFYAENSKNKDVKPKPAKDKQD